MCFNALEAAVAACGLQTRVLFHSCANAEQALRAVLPYGKIVLISDENCDYAVAAALREKLKNYRPVSVVLGKTDNFTGLFSLPDDVRAAVGIGERSAFAARFFVTLCGGYSLVIPLSPSARGLFEAVAPAGTSWPGYPLRAADVVVADAALMRPRAAEALAETAFSALCAEDTEIDAVFSSDRKEFGFRAAADLLAEADVGEDEGIERLFRASALNFLSMRGAPAFACIEAAEAFAGKTAAEGVRFALFEYFVRRYVRLFAEGEPRLFYVPDYAARIERCAAWSGKSSEKLFKNVRVPTAAESFRRAEMFGECRKKLLTSALLLVAFAEKARGKYYAAGGARACLGERELCEAYERSAELTPLLSPPVLEREFGLLPSFARGGICGSAHTDGKRI